MAVSTTVAKTETLSPRVERFLELLVTALRQAEAPAQREQRVPNQTLGLARRH
jgi:hypothetical protein